LENDLYSLLPPYIFADKDGKIKNDIFIYKGKIINYKLISKREKNLFVMKVLKEAAQDILNERKNS